MKKFLKSSALALLFFIAHWVVQLFFSILIANIVVFIDTLKDTLQATDSGTFIYKGIEVTLEEVNMIYSSMAAIPAVIMTAIFLIVLYWGVFKLLNIKFREYINLRKLSKKLNIYGLMCGAALYYPVIFIISSTFIKDLSPEANNVMEQIMKNSPFIMQFIGVGIIGPIIEEITFRGLIYSNMKKSVPVVPAIIIQALLFGLIHMNLQQFIYASFLGIVFGFILEWTGSLSTTILAHIGFNSVSLLSGKLFSVLGKILHEEQLALLFLLLFVVSVVISITIIQLFYKNRKSVHTYDILDRNDNFY